MEMKDFSAHVYGALQMIRLSFRRTSVSDNGSIPGLVSLKLITLTH